MYIKHYTLYMELYMESFQSDVQLNNKMLAELAIYEPKTFQVGKSKHQKYSVKTWNLVVWLIFDAMTL